MRSLSPFPLSSPATGMCQAPIRMPRSKTFSHLRNPPPSTLKGQPKVPTSMTTTSTCLCPLPSISIQRRHHCLGAVKSIVAAHALTMWVDPLPLPTIPLHCHLLPVSVVDVKVHRPPATPMKAQANNSSHDGLIEDRVLDKLPSGSESDSSDADADPTAVMLNGIGLFVIPVDEEMSILACIDCQKGLKPSNALKHVISKPHRLKVSKPKQAELMPWPGLRRRRELLLMALKTFLTTFLRTRHRLRG